jgi:hypothetical protein
MKTRQFRQLASKGFDARLPLLIDGLETIGANISRIAAELQVCNSAQASRAAGLLANVGKEEAGKFLILIDSCRAPESDQGAISRQFGRAGNHLAKLIYAQVADYRIASQEELLRAVDDNRRSLYLDGPNDVDWIFPNRLIAERERALYVDLVESEDELEWVAPRDECETAVFPKPHPRSVRLVSALIQTGIVSASGLSLLQEAWRGFQPRANTHYSEWARRSTAALQALVAGRQVDDDWARAASSVVDLWPMPMVEIDISQVEVTAKELAERRDALHAAMMAREYGFDFDDPAIW